MKSKVGLVVLVVIVTSLLFSAFPAFGQDKIELQVTWWGSQDRHDRTIKVIEMYEEANPNIDIVYEFAGFADYWTKVNTQAAGDQLACVLQQDYRYITEWQSRGLLLPLDPFIEDGTIDTTNISEDMLVSGRVDGDLYAFNLGNNSQTFVLDVAAFEAAGIELPPTDWTWADFEAIALQLHEASGIWAFGPTLPDVALWASLYQGLGQSIYTEDGKALGYTDDQPLVDYFNMIMRLQDAGAIPTQDEAAEYADAGPESAPIVSGLAAMDYRWSNQVIAVTSAAGEGREFALYPLPRRDDGESQNYIKPSMFFSIPTQCEHPEEAAKFINYFVNDLAANEVLFAERGVPVSTAVAEHLQPMLEPIIAQTFDFLALIASYSTPILPADPPGAADLRDNVYTPLFVEPVLYRQISIEEGVAILREEADRILSESN